MNGQTDVCVCVIQSVLVCVCVSERCRKCLYKCVCEGESLSVCLRGMQGVYMCVRVCERERAMRAE